MGIFNQSEGTLPYVPPLATGGAAPCTLLGRDRAEVTPIRYEPDAPATSIFGDSAQPAAGQYDDLNRSPATTVELRFRHVRFPGYDTGYDHAFIVATDNATGRQVVHQAGPWGPGGNTILGGIAASTEEYTKDKSRDYGASYRAVSRFQTDASIDAVKRKLEEFSDRFNREQMPYQLPPMLPMVPRATRDRLPTLNSNYYGGAAWEYLTGTSLKLPDDIDAPGWADHLRAPIGPPP